jgi:hypothetical protein
VNSGEFVFENATCRYVVALRKFVLKVGTEIQLPLLQHPQVHGMFVKLRQHSHAVRGGGTVDNQGSVEMRSEGGATIHPDRSDPDGGMSIAEISFEHSDSGKEFSGMISFCPWTFTLYMVDASAHDLKVAWTSYINQMQ